MVDEKETINGVRSVRESLPVWMNWQVEEEVAWQVDAALKESWVEL